MIVLKYLWKLSSHRPAFRGIASMTNDDSSAMYNVGVSDENSMDTTTAVVQESSSSNSTDNTQHYFIRFANGLMNETNALVTSTMEKLSDIKKIQTTMKSPAEWAALGEEGQTQMKERLDQFEREVKGTAGLCTETLHMLNYLTSDEQIRVPFLMDEILPRFVSMMTSVLNKIVGSKSLEIKVDNMDSYNFEPKVILREVCQAMVHFATFPRFYQMLAQDGFYGDGTVLRKAIATVDKLSLLTAEEVAALQRIYDASQEAKLSSMVYLTCFTYLFIYAYTDSAPYVYVCAVGPGHPPRGPAGRVPGPAHEHADARSRQAPYQWKYCRQVINLHSFQVFHLLYS